jgi:CBS domain-containing protein
VKQVQDVMSKNPVCCTADQTAQDVAKTLRDQKIGSVPVVADQQSRRLEGVVTDRDLCCTVIADGKDPKSTKVSDSMTRNPVACKAQDSLEDCLKLMQQHKIRRLPIVDDQKRVIGIIAQADVSVAADPEKVQKTLAEISKAPAQHPPRGRVAA